MENIIKQLTEEEKQTYKEVKEYKHLNVYLTDKQKLECSYFLNELEHMNFNFNRINRLKKDLSDLFNCYYYNQNRYMKIISKCFRLVENEYLSNFSLDNITEYDDLEEMLKLINCSSKYNEYLFKYKENIEELKKNRELS